MNSEQIQDKNQRIETLDWLRGLMAFAIMLYHVCGWLLNPLDASTFLGRLGIYGVSVFFILSGLSMAAAYQYSFINVYSYTSFFVRRFFRIAPLFWLACIFVVLLKILNQQAIFPFNTLFLNATLLFGFIEPSTYMTTGAWSIGNEMVYYAFTPAIILLFNYSKNWGNIFFIGTILLGVYFANYALFPTDKLSSQWGTYINPFNNFFFYVMGIFIYYNMNQIQLPASFVIWGLLLSVTALYLSPFNGNQIHIVTGWPRMYFSLLSFILVCSFFKLRIQLPCIVERLLTKSGVYSYGIYLLHPLIYMYMQYFLAKFHIHPNKYVLFGSIVLLTLILASLSYTYIEARFIAMGKSLLKKRTA